MNPIDNSIPRIKKTIYSIFIKRVFDILLSGMALIILSPVLLIVSILELFFHGSPIIYSQDRPGKDGELFKLYKFRSMTNATDENGELLPSDKRLTKFGKIIRRLSIDELPELWCIFTGKMSIIGPRPLLPAYMPYYTERHQARHAVKPGLACVSLHPMKTWTWNDQFENDIWYVENISFTVDVKMIFAVAKEALVGSEYRVNDSRKKFSPDYWKEG